MGGISGLAGCGPEGPPPLAALLVTLDTLRADHLGCAGHPTVRTPHLDRLERRGVHWRDAVTGIPLTTPSHATILTGRTPRSHRVLKNRMRLGRDVPTLAAELAGAGIRTGAIVSNGVVLGPEFGLDRGFDTYEVMTPARMPASGEGAETTRTATRWIAENGGPGSFLWVHSFDAHLPYLPPAPLDQLYDPTYEGAWHLSAEPVQNVFRDEPGDTFDERDVVHQAALYAAEVTFLDGCVGDLVRAAGAAVVLVTADHGEGLWEHDRYFGHDLLLYETSLKVPMILAAGGHPVRRLTAEAARTRDVAPTLLGLFGIDPDAGMDGRDLLREPPPVGDDLAFVAESHPSRDKAPSLFALRTGDRKVVWKSRRRRHEAYDLVADPAETHDLWGGDPVWEVLAEDLSLDLRNRPVGSTRTIDDEAGGLEDETREALQALGYVD